MMQDNRNTAFGSCNDNRGMVCIDTKRVLDCCRDRDCFEDSRVYLTTFGEEVLAAATNIRAKSARILWTYVGVDEVPFNCGFYRITIKYYISVEFEACLGIGKSQSFFGLTTLEKDVILFGGEGDITSYSSDTNAGYCSFGDAKTVSTNAPVAVVEVVDPIVLGYKVKDCTCVCGNECIELPDCVRNCFEGDLVNTNTTQRLYVSIGLFSVVRIERPAQLLVQATDYSVPDKECFASDANDNPCDLFRTMSFPVSRFRGTSVPVDNQTIGGGSGCGCNKK